MGRSKWPNFLLSWLITLSLKKLVATELIFDASTKRKEAPHQRPTAEPKKCRTFAFYHACLVSRPWQGLLFIPSFVYHSPLYTIFTIFRMCYCNELCLITCYQIWQKAAKSIDRDLRFCLFWRGRRWATNFDFFGFLPERRRYRKAIDLEQCSAANFALERSGLRRSLCPSTSLFTLGGLENKLLLIIKYNVKLFMKQPSSLERAFSVAIWKRNYYVKYFLSILHFFPIFHLSSKPKCIKIKILKNCLFLDWSVNILENIGPSAFCLCRSWLSSVSETQFWYATTGQSLTCYFLWKVAFRKWLKATVATQLCVVAQLDFA